MPRRKKDKKVIAIAVLSAVVLVEAFFLFFHKPKTVTVIKEKIVVVKEKAEKEKPAPREVTPKPVLGRIAIIVDDCGYNLRPCEFSKTIKSPVAFAVLPNLRHSTEVGTCVHQNRKEVMLHLPMEPHHNEDKYPKNYLILTSMDRKAIEGIITKSLNSVPNADGVNNHMGSKATENMEVMAVVLRDLKRRGLFFVDSLVTGHSVCPTLARSINLPFGKRDIFLDNENTREYIRQQFDLLAKEAREKGFAVAIGHDRLLTLQLIREETERLEKDGFKIVPISELVK